MVQAAKAAMRRNSVIREWIRGEEINFMGFEDDFKFLIQTTQYTTQNHGMTHIRNSREKILLQKNGALAPPSPCWLHYAV